MTTSSSGLSMSTSPSLAKRRAVVLVNIGTPQAPTVPEVRKYLAEFLGDPRVIDLPAPLRWLLLNAVILPFRPKRSAHAYQQIWTPEGSPLLLHSKAQAQALQAALPGFEVVLAMRYGEPSLDSALAKLRAQGIGEVTVIPLYPQFASATTVSTVERVASLAKDFSVSVVPAFHSEAGFVDACARQVKEVVARVAAQHVLFSYHGLPVRQLKPYCGATCSGAASCGALTASNAQCYRAQCYATSAAIAGASGLKVETSTAFQSRLKGSSWLQPFTDEAVVALARSGVKRLAVACPSFVADCLETLEEIGQRAAATFVAAGGESLTLVPAVNADAGFISMLAARIS